jgi:hypothetical protein
MQQRGLMIGDRSETRGQLDIHTGRSALALEDVIEARVGGARGTRVLELETVREGFLC